MQTEITVTEIAAALRAPFAHPSIASKCETVVADHIHSKLGVAPQYEVPARKKVDYGEIELRRRYWVHAVSVHGPMGISEAIDRFGGTHRTHVKIADDAVAAGILAVRKERGRGNGKIVKKYGGAFE